MTVRKIQASFGFDKARMLALTKVDVPPCECSAWEKMAMMG